jgi:RNA polymerase sigma factor (sigma-70 family)
LKQGKVMSLPPLSAPGYRDSREEDRRLLNQYVRQQSQSAFAALLKRHLNFVYSVCLREVRQPELAQDAAQIVFLALAQQAPRLRNNTVLKSWLFQVARYAARDMRRKEVRRALREQRACEEPCRSWPPSRPSADANPESEIEPLLNEALAALNPGERSLILLRFFEERSFKEVGNAHHISEDAARMRVTRALARMRRFFQTAGIVLSVEALTALLPRHAAQAAPFSPEALFPELQSADPSRLSGTLTEPSRRIATKGVLRAMNRTTWKMVALAGLGMALLFGGVAWRERHAVPASAPTKAQSDLAAKLASDNKAAITAIQTYYAEVKLVYEPAKVQRTARYWRGRAIVRITEQEQADRVVDIECKDDRKTIITTLPKPPLPNEGRVQITDKNRRATECDAWEWSLFQLPVGLYSTPPKSLYTLSEALQK